MSASTARRFLVGVSLKMYFSHAGTLDWCRRVGDIARAHPSTSGTDAAASAELFVIPSFPSIAGAFELLSDAVTVGAQDLATEDTGAFTGEVSGAVLAELGCRVVEVGHAERRRLFGETEDIIAAKTLAALRNGLVPIVCIGELERNAAVDAAAECVRQLESALAAARSAGVGGRLIVAYEPIWAIGAVEPAPDEHIRTVCAAMREHIAQLAEFTPSDVIYGGSAGPGLVTRIFSSVDGVFLGRYVHDPEALRAILDEVAKMSRTESAELKIEYV